VDIGNVAHQPRKKRRTSIQQMKIAIVMEKKKR
jgi:hypothetical protein